MFPVPGGPTVCYEFEDVIQVETTEGTFGPDNHRRAQSQEVAETYLDSSHRFYLALESESQSLDGSILFNGTSDLALL